MPGTHNKRPNPTYEERVKRRRDAQRRHKPSPKLPAPKDNSFMKGLREIGRKAAETFGMRRVKATTEEAAKR